MISVKNLIDKIFQVENQRYFAAISYMPFIGWLIPLYLRRDIKLCQTHAKQGFLLAAFIISLVMLFSLLNIFLPSDWREVRLVLVVLIYILYLLYFFLCIIGVVWSLNEKELMLPIVGKYAGQLRL